MAPAMLAPAMLAPAMGEPAKSTSEDDGKTALDSDSKVLPNTEPISLLKSGVRPGENG
jgi:hypothetical protein